MNCMCLCIATYHKKGFSNIASTIQEWINITLPLFNVLQLLLVARLHTLHCSRVYVYTICIQNNKQQNMCTRCCSANK